MADPWKGKKLPAGVKWAPSALDDVPADWASVDYVVSIAPHPDNVAEAVGDDEAAPAGFPCAAEGWLCIDTIGI